MKKLFLFIVLLPAYCWPEGPLFHHKDSTEEQEFENVYQDMRSKAASIQSRTKSQLSAEVPAINSIYLCTDCSIDGLVISTGTTAGSFSRATSRTTAIQ